MNKGTKKDEKFKYNRQIIDKLVEKYGMTNYYIRQCASGKRSGITPDKIQKEYRQLSKAAEDAVSQKIDSL